MRPIGGDRPGPGCAVGQRSVDGLIDELDDQAQGRGAGEVPRRLGRQSRQAGDDGECDGAETHREVRTFAHLIEQAGGENAGEEYDPEHWLHGREPPAEQPANGNAKRDLGGRAEPVPQ
jgi:hypothetical protein